MVSTAESLPDPQSLWETAQLEIALEGSNGCSLDRLWKLVNLVEPTSHSEKEGRDDKEPSPTTFLRRWLWRNIVARRSQELSLTKYNGSTGQWENLKRGDDEDSRLAAIEDVDALKDKEKEVGVVASTHIRLRVLGLDTATLRSITLVSPLYVQVLEVVGKHRGRGATIDDVLDGVNALNKSNKKDEYMEVVAAQWMNGRGPIRSAGHDPSSRGSGGMVPSQLYPVYDRLTKAGLVFKSIMQKPNIADSKTKKEYEMFDIVSRFIMLYLSPFKDKIQHEMGCRLEPTAREVFMEMVVGHLLEVTGGAGAGAVVPFQNIRQALSLNKHEASRLKNFLEKEARMPDSPIKLHMLDLHVLTYESKRGTTRPELCVSLKHSAELEPLALQRPICLSLSRCVVGIAKSLPEQGANVELMTRKLHFGKKCAGRVLDMVVERPSTYGICKGYTREGRSAKVQSLFYDKNLIGSGNTLRGAPSIVEANASAPAPPTAVASMAANAPAGDGGGGGDSTCVVKASSDAPDGKAAGADSGDPAALSFSVNDMDAFVDTVMDEMDEAFQRTVEARAKFETDHVYPPPGISEGAKNKWKLMLPVEKRKEFILEELKKCTAITMTKMLHLLRLMEGPGPVLYKRTMDKLIHTMVSEGTIKRAIAPFPREWVQGPTVRFFGSGEMLLRADAPTDSASMIDHANKFRDLEFAVSNEMASVKKEKLHVERKVVQSKPPKNRLLVYTRKMHRTMILHRELLRCLPRLGTQKEESRMVDLDRIMLDIPLIMFMTMFGYPPEYLHAMELHRTLRAAENNKATVREAPWAIWELMRHNRWFKDKLTSSLQILHDMSVLVKINPPELASQDGSASADQAGPVFDPLAYSNASVKIPVVPGVHDSESEAISAIEIYDEYVKSVAAGKNRVGRGFVPHSKRGMSRDRKARSAAAQVLLQAKEPPAEMKLGLGWACLGMNLVVYLANKTVRKRVTDDTKWWDFWTCYQMHGTGKRKASADNEEDLDLERPLTPLSPLLLAKVPELADPAEWGVDDPNATTGVHTSWHLSAKSWTQKEDMEILKIVSKAYRDPTPNISIPSRPGRPSSWRAYKEALAPFSESINVSLEACWKRFIRLEGRYGGVLPSFPLPAIASTAQKKRSREPEDLQLDEKEKNRRRKLKKARQSGLLARDGPIDLAELDPSRMSSVDLAEARNKARQEAAIAKAAGFEWVNEEGSWDEDHPGGGILPRPFKSWAWTMEELAAFTAVRQLLLAPDILFSPGRPLKRMEHLRPPTIQKAYRVLLSLKQADFTEEAWGANSRCAQDCIDHEVYKIMGRHGPVGPLGPVVTRGIVAKAELCDVGFETKWSNPLALGGGETVESSDGFGVRLKQLYSPRTSLEARSVLSLAGISPMPIKDVGVDREMFSAVLETVARSAACFTVSVIDNAIDSAIDNDTCGTAGMSAASQPSSQPGGSGTSKPTDLEVHAESTSSRGRNQGTGQEGSTGGGVSSVVEPEALVDEGSPNKAGDIGLAGKYGPTVKFRSPKTIDVDVMATAVAEVKAVEPVAAVEGSTGVEKTRGGARTSPREWWDACEVRGPETEWGSPPGSCGVGSDALVVLVKALEARKVDGLTLSQLRKAVEVEFPKGGGGLPASDEVELAALGCALRAGTAVCVCGAEDVKYIHKDSAKVWIVQTAHEVGPQPTKPSDKNISGLSRATNMEMGKIENTSPEGEGTEEAENISTAKGWKGKGKMRMTKKRSGGKSVDAPDDTKTKVWFPWMTLDGEVDLPLLNRLRQDLVAYVKSQPGSSANEIRSSEFSYLSGGEVILLLRDLVRREVLLEVAVPDTSEVMITGGWGLACQNEEWNIESASACGKQVGGRGACGGPSTAAYLPAPEWLEAILKLVRTEQMRVTS